MFPKPFFTIQRNKFVTNFFRTIPFEKNRKGKILELKEFPAFRNFFSKFGNLKKW
jgi:hypothetical protein